MRLWLGGLLLWFVASHLLYLMFMEPGQLVTYEEELYRGTIAREIVTGLKAPLWEYRADNYSGGSLVIGGLAAGLFLLLGPTLFALKLAPIALFALTLAFWYWTIRRASGERAAGYFALLFCLSPPLLTAHAVTAMGFHSESTVFSALSVFLFFEMLSDESDSPAYPALLGLTAGFGLWFCYTYGLTLLALLGYWLWRDRATRSTPRVLWFALGFAVGFSPWIVINAQNHFAGLMVRGIRVWDHFGLEYLREGLSHPRRLAPYEFFAEVASDDPRGVPRRAVNLLYSLLYLGPILTAGVLRLKTARSKQAQDGPARPSLAGFGLLYLVVLTLALQLSDFTAFRYHVPAYPVLLFLAADALARCEDRLPRVRRQIQVVFSASVIVLAAVAHAPLVSLDRPGAALSVKGYAYAFLPETYVYAHSPAGPAGYQFVLEVAQKPFFSSIRAKLPSDDQRELSLGIALLLAEAVPINGRAEDFSRIERLVPPGFDRHFYYQAGTTAMGRFPAELSKAVDAMEVVRHRSAAAHHLALVGIYRHWPRVAELEGNPESLAHSPVAVTAALSPHYWRALGNLTSRYWYEADRSLSALDTRLQAFVPRLDPEVQRSFLQGVGELLFGRVLMTPGVAPAELERFPAVYQEGLLEGFGMALGERDVFSTLPWKGEDSLYWTTWTKGLSTKSLAFVRQGRAQFESLFEARPLAHQTTSDHLTGVEIISRRHAQADLPVQEQTPRHPEAPRQGGAEL